MSDFSVSLNRVPAPTLAPYAPVLGLAFNPFPVTPDETHYFFTSEIEAIYEEVRHFIEMRKGFLLLTGDIGLGKTTLLRRLLASFDTSRYNTALLLTSFLNKNELLESIARDFDLALPADARRIDHLTALNAFLLAESAKEKINVLFIDDAQALDADALDVVRQLSNLETAEAKLIQVVLCGQPEVLETLGQYSLRQVKSRIALHRQLLPLSVEQTLAYISHRLDSARGGSDAHGVRMTPQALTSLHAHTAGFPRRIHHLMDRCLYALLSQGEHRINENTVARAAQDLGWTTPESIPDANRKPESGAAAPRPMSARLWVGITALSILAVAGFVAWRPSPATGPVTGATTGGSTPVQPMTAEAVAVIAPPSATPAHPAAPSPMKSALADLPTPENQAASDLIQAPSQWQTTRAAYAGLASLTWPKAHNMPELAQAFGQALAPHNWQWVTATGEWSSACAERPIQQLRDDRGQTWHFSFIESGWPTTPVAMGYKSEAIFNLQRMLATQNWLESNQVDGVMGPRTVSGLARFQQGQGLAGTGQFDAATAYRLSCRLAGGVPAAKGMPA